MNISLELYLELCKQIEVLLREHDTFDSRLDAIEETMKAMKLDNFDLTFHLLRKYTRFPWHIEN